MTVSPSSWSHCVRYRWSHCVRYRWSHCVRYRWAHWCAPNTPPSHANHSPHLLHTEPPWYGGSFPPGHCMATASAVLLMPYPTRSGRVTFFLVTLCEIQMVTLCEIQMGALCEIQMGALCEIQMVTLCEIQMVTLCEIQMGALLCAQHAPVTRQPLSTPFTHRGAVARRSPLNTLHTQWHRETDPLALCFAPRCCGTEVTLLSMATNPLTPSPSHPNYTPRHGYKQRRTDCASLFICQIP